VTLGWWLTPAASAACCAGRQPLPCGHCMRHSTTRHGTAWRSSATRVVCVSSFCSLLRRSSTFALHALHVAHHGTA
jgi:hypothetical protein